MQIPFLWRRRQVTKQRDDVVGVGGDDTSIAKVAVDPESLQKGKINIAYQPGLVDKLKRDHRRLFDICRRINGVVKARGYREIPILLSEFDREFKAHILQENLLFYAFMEAELTKSPVTEEALETMKDIKSDMRPIALAVKQFLKRWQPTDLNDGNIGTFYQEFKGAVAVLKQRVTLEESSLYPLYQVYSE